MFRKTRGKRIGITASSQTSVASIASTLSQCDSAKEEPMVPFNNTGSAEETK